MMGCKLLIEVPVNGGRIRKEKNIKIRLKVKKRIEKE